MYKIVMYECTHGLGLHLTRGIIMGPYLLLFIGPYWDIYQLYAHGKDFLLILTYWASCMQKLESVYPLIEKIAK